MREFSDAGCRWMVWETAPAAGRGLADEYRRGWLTFDNEVERRRLAPVPKGWATLADDRLALLLRVATRVVRREHPRRLAAS